MLDVEPLKRQRGDLVFGIAYVLGFLLQNIGGGTHKTAPVDQIEILFARSREEPRIVYPQITESRRNLLDDLFLKLLPSLK